ncbi:hypothetical protein QTG56_24835 (plasmid) [Rossellomorea sp. AcN35-11]|nr:hypothetical protein [Rossellomorea aquimaris]WJV31862.1 hypothetical protein QTG56_24835 [Rossellomorea sp. AcN35-11]
MKFCRECGNQLKEEALFCKECGNKVSLSEEKETVSGPLDKQRKLMSKKSKIWIASSVVVAILLLGAFKVGEALTSEARLIDKFETALVNHDAESVSKLLDSNDKKLKISEKNIAGFIKLFKEQPDLIPGTIKLLKSQARILTSDTSPADGDMQGLLEDLVGTGLVNLEEDGKFLFFDKYKITVDPVYVEIGTNYKDTVLLVDGKEVGKSDKPEYKSTFGPFVPGYHKLEGKLKTDFVDLVAKEEVLLDDTYQLERKYIEIEADDVRVSLPSGLKGEVKLLINGKDVGVNLAESNTFGPVLVDGSMKLSVETDLPWGKVKTREVPIESDEVKVKLVSNELTTEITETIQTYISEYYAAVTTLDESNLTVATAERKAEIMDQAKSYKRNEGTVKFQHVSSKMDLDSVETHVTDGIWQAYIVSENTSKEWFNSIAKDSNDYRDAVDQKYYYLEYNPTEKKWLVDEDKSTSGKHLTNPKEFVVKEPKEYVSNWVGSDTTEVVASPSSNGVFTNSGNVPDGIMKETENYAMGLVEAINNNNFSLVEPYLMKNSNLYESQKELVSKLSSKGIKESYVSFDIYDYWADGGDVVVYTTEKVKITYGDGTSETKNFKWRYFGGLGDNGDLKFTEIKEAND